MEDRPEYCDKENIVQLNKPTVSDARLKCFSDYTPIRDIEIVDTKQGIWKGKRVVEPGTNPDVMTVIYFRRTKGVGPITKPTEPTELELMWPELHIKDCSIMGYEFYLIPKIKMIFGYDPASSIIVKAPMSMKKPGPFTG